MSYFTFLRAFALGLILSHTYIPVQALTQEEKETGNIKTPTGESLWDFLFVDKKEEVPVAPAPNPESTSMNTTVEDEDLGLSTLFKEDENPDYTVKTELIAPDTSKAQIPEPLSSMSPELTKWRKMDEEPFSPMSPEMTKWRRMEDEPFSSMSPEMTKWREMN